MVRAKRLELPRRLALDPKSSASAIPPRPHVRIKWLGWQDSNLANAGVKVPCLAAWRHPNVNLPPLGSFEKMG